MEEGDFDDDDGRVWVPGEEDGVYVAANDTTYLWEHHVTKHGNDANMVAALSGPPINKWSPERPPSLHRFRQTTIKICFRQTDISTLKCHYQTKMYANYPMTSSNFFEINKIELQKGKYRVNFCGKCPPSMVQRPRPTPKADVRSTTPPSPPPVMVRTRLPRRNTKMSRRRHTSRRPTPKAD
jgi:hypothetical protein